MNPKEQIIKLIKDAIAKNLPDVKPEDLEENGKVYYMNDRDGTIFDWTMNEHACPFMCFYNDGMGAAKANMYSDGNVEIYVYDTTKDHKYVATEKGSMDKDDVLALTCFMFFNADEKDRFGKSLDDLEYAQPSAEELEQFNNECKPEE